MGKRGDDTDSPYPSLEEFHDRVESAAGRVADLTRQSEASPERAIGVLSSALAEYQTAFEELMVAEDEIRAQSVELARVAEQAETERRAYWSLFEHAPDGYLVTDALGVIRDANRAAGLILGVDPRFLVGKPLSVFVAPGDRNRFRSLLSALSLHRGAQLWEARLVPRDGEAVHVSVSVAAREGGRYPTEVRWIIRNVTEQRRAEEEIRRAKEELEARVAERTAELEEAGSAKEKLLQSEKAAREEAEQARDRSAALANHLESLLQTVSHDLRSPLASVLGSAQMIDRSPERTDNVRRLAWQVTSGARHMEQILRDVVDSLRVEAGQVVVVAQEVDLASLVRDQVSRQQDAPGRIRVEAAEDLPTVITDPNLVRRVVDNLLGNALKYSPEAAEVEVRLKSELGRVVVAVADTGRGIPQDAIPHLFERYFRSPDERSRTDGFGLGLYITKGLVDALGGSVEVESEVGRGSTFRVSLPISGPPESGARLG